MQLNEERVKLFAHILRTGFRPEDAEALVRLIAETVPVAPIDVAAPIIHPIPPVALEPGPYIFPPCVPGVPWTPMKPLIGDPPGWPNNPTVICQGNTNTGATAMTQADGQGDDSGLRAD